MNQSPSTREVAITGIGIVSPIGIGVDRFWENLSSGHSGVHHCQLFPVTASPDAVGGEVTDFTEDAAKKGLLKEQRRNVKAMCREIQMGVASAVLALQHGQVDLATIDHERLGVEFGANLMLSAPDILEESCNVCCDPPGSNHFEFNKWGQTGLPRLEPLWLLRYLPNMPACHISISADARGPSNSLTMDDASCNCVLGEARRVLMRGHADILISGTTGTTLHPIKTLHLGLWHDLATTPAEPERRCRPFDLNRSGRVVGEGACTFILEDLEHAQKRGAKIWARLLGTGSSCVLSPTGVVGTRLALANAMRTAIRDAGLKPEQIGHINAHGLGTRTTDIEEAKAILDVFGDDLGRKIPVTALKSFLGNSGAGSGSMELAGSLLGLTHGVIPHTLNYETPDPECPLNIVTGKPLPTDNRIVLKINVTRMGQASASIIEVNAA
jgi:3-oxoacyl-[acyl-carrier-protein] synthase II